jgi:starch synthase (maltosyl-transferring)
MLPRRARPRPASESTAGLDATPLTLPLPVEHPSDVVIEPVSPVVDGGRFMAKATVGETVAVVASVFASGHGVRNAALRWRRRATGGPEGGTWHETPMLDTGNDRFTATFVPDELGVWEYEIIGWTDRAESWRRGVIAKVAAGQNVDVELAGGRELLTAMREHASAAGHDDDRTSLTALEQYLDEGQASALDDDHWTDVFRRHGSRSRAATIPTPLLIDVDPRLARFSSWYEFFPRSPIAPASGHQTLRDAEGHLDHIASMGFDAVYLPPVHPIGSTKRKGANNNVVAGPDDVGSPWAIGSSAGGHTAVHPDLGTVADVAHFAEECAARGMALALDIAFQCSPDHPWVTEHPQWFAHRADGSIQYAENPPKRYEDIYPIDFESEDWPALWEALADVFRFWVDHGVTIFRVDNPHTKAFAFWEWALRTLRTEHPDTIFLAEAFTRPRTMERLAKIGFSQSYTYFTWRQEAWDLREYFTDLATRTVDYFRPNAWPNTPDILTEQLQEGGRNTFALRALLAATLSPSWGVYGPAYELIEHEAVRPGSEEYLDSEKYQLRQWHLDDDQSLAPLLARLNFVRRDHAALQHLRTLRFHLTDNDQILCYSKTDPDGVGDPVLVVVNLDAVNRQMGFVDVDLEPLGLPYGASYEVTDQLSGATFQWHANRNFVDLGPDVFPGHIFVVRGGTR